MPRLKKPVSYLATAAWTSEGGQWGNKSPITLTHSRYKIVRANSADDAQAQANLFANLFASHSPTLTVVKAKPRKAPSNAMPRLAKSDDQWKDTAEQYARWLANRDGIAIPKGLKTKAIWDSVPSKTRKNAKGLPVQERRIRALAWGTPGIVKNAHGQRLADSFETELTIDIPHWDWTPDPAIEQRVEDAESRKAA